MNIHQNARLTPRGRVLLIERLERGEVPNLLRQNIDGTDWLTDDDQQSIA